MRTSCVEDPSSRFRPCAGKPRGSPVLLDGFEMQSRAVEEGAADRCREQPPCGAGRRALHAFNRSGVKPVHHSVDLLHRNRDAELSFQPPCRACSRLWSLAMFDPSIAQISVVFRHDDAGDDVAVNFGRAVKDARNARIADVTLEIHVARIAVAAMNLQCRVGDFVNHL